MNIASTNMAFWMWAKAYLSRCGIVPIAVLAIFLSPAERAQGQSNLLLAAGEAGDSYHALGVGLMSLVKVTLLHDQDIDLSVVEEADAGRRAEMVQAGAVDLALLADDETSVLPGANTLGVISQFKLTGDQGLAEETINLVGNQNLDNALIEKLTKAIIEEERWLSGALPGLSRLSPEDVTDNNLTWHQGALAYYLTLNPNLEATSAASFGTPDIFMIYFGESGSALNEVTSRQIDLACGHAAERGASSVLVGGPGDVMRLDSSGIRLSDVEAQAILDQLRSRDGCQYAIIDQETSGTTFSERYAPNVPITGDRRLEVAVIPTR